MKFLTSLSFFEVGKFSFHYMPMRVERGVKAVTSGEKI